MQQSVLEDVASHNAQPGGCIDFHHHLGREAIDFICLDGLALDNQGRPVELTLPRVNPLIPSLDDPPRDEHVITRSLEKLSGGASEPVSGQERRLTVRLSLKDAPMAVTGRSAVYEVSEAVVLSVDNTPIPGLRLPPLVAKIARETTGRNLHHEAGMYRLLDSVQGIIVARCYGYFRGSVNLRELVIKPWDPHAKFPRSEDTFDIFRPPNPYASLGILLLEKLGPPASTLRTVPIGMLEQLQEMVRTLVELDVTHEDLYGRNVLHAPDPECGETTSGHGDSGKPYTYQWRIIGLEDCKPSDLVMEDNLGGMTNDVEELVHTIYSKAGGMY
ncbi:hypothetical protein C8Q73DRAFT_714804 [Cubamyces lactineus]|nr:hypothetical protein C8Q73DRAFT_714804 [Cubamyces lactineus]